MQYVNARQIRCYFHPKLRNENDKSDAYETLFMHMESCISFKLRPGPCIL
jgi:hypothetical protein